MRSLELRVPPDVVALVALAAMWLVSRAAPSPAVPLKLPLGIVLLVAGVTIIVAARVQLARARTTFSPIAPTRSSSLVTSGLYAVSRNPIYLGMAAALLGAAVLFGSAAGLAVVVAAVVYLDRFQIVPEERALKSLFGPRYEEYRAHTRRWM